MKSKQELEAYAMDEFKRNNFNEEGALKLCLEEASKYIDSMIINPTRDGSLDCKKILSFVYDLVPYARYDNPVLAKQIYESFKKDRTIPSSSLTSARGMYTKVKDLRSRLDSEDAHYNAEEIFNKPKRLPACARDNSRRKIHQEDYLDDVIKAYEERPEE
jgi:hypothetical protein